MVFFGGEPLLRRDLRHETIRYCREIRERTGQPFHFKITTNGSSSRRSLLDRPADGGGLRRAQLRRRSGRARPAPRGRGRKRHLRPPAARHRSALGHKPDSPVMLVTTPETESRYADSARFLSGCGFRYLICSLDYAGKWTRASLREFDRQYEMLADWYEAKTEREVKFYFSPFDVKIASHIFKGAAGGSAANWEGTRSQWPPPAGSSLVCSSSATAGIHRGASEITSPPMR